MRITAYEPRWSAAATASYNRITAGLPHCRPATENELIATINAGEIDYEGEKKFRDPATWLAVDDDRVLGLAQAAVFPRDDDTVGVIRFLGYEPGYRLAGDRLLNAAEEHLRQHGMSQVEIGHSRYRWPIYHHDHACLTDRLAQVHGLLGMHGYERRRGEVFLDWPDFDPPAVPDDDLGVEIAVQHRPTDAVRPGFVLNAVHDGEVVGDCVNKSRGDDAPGTEAEDWGFTCWLGVEEPWQGKRLGMRLLLTALGEMKRLGYKHAGISTNVTNHRAQVFYANLGYRAVDWTYWLTKDLTGPAANESV